MGDKTGRSRAPAQRAENPRRDRWGVVERRAASLEEARALAHPLRLRILRLCLDDAMTNRQLAASLGLHPATVLHHVRSLVATGFLREEASRPGRRGSIEKPYRASGKSWRMDVADTGERSAVERAMLEAVAAEIEEAGAGAVIEMDRLAMRLSPEQLQELRHTLADLAGHYAEIDDPGGEPVALLLALHRRPS
ncbi:MAG: helix-turn-helix domain-containing protein [Acidimicrobiales bacterium]